MTSALETREAQATTKPQWDKQVIAVIRERMPSLNREKVDSLAFHVWQYAQHNHKDFLETTQIVADTLVEFANKNGFPIAAVASVAKDLLAAELPKKKKRRLNKHKSTNP